MLYGRELLKGVRYGWEVCDFVLLDLRLCLSRCRVGERDCFGQTDASIIVDEIRVQSSLSSTNTTDDAMNNFQDSRHRR